MNLHRYKDYEEYRAIQSPGNPAFKQWVNEQNIRFAAEFLLSRGAVRFGICHGSRYGNEQRWFAQFLQGARIIGTDISEEYREVPNTFVWDFHEFNPDWAGADFIYSNALDHARDPERALRSWARTLKVGGVLIIEHTNNHEGEATPLDPFRATLAEMLDLIPKWSGLQILDVLDTPFRYRSLTYSKFIIAGKA